MLASAALFERIVLTVNGASARWGAVAFAVIAVGDVWMGRLAFAMGVSLALAAVLALVRGRVAWAGALAALCAAASPVAGVLLALAGVTHALYQRSPRSALALAVPACAVVAALALLFPEGGTEPYPTLSFAATALVVLAFLWALPAPERLLRVGALVYLLACVAVPDGPLAARQQHRALRRAAGRAPARVRGRTTRGRGAAAAAVVTALALCAVAVWVAWGPVRETLAVAGNESTRASYYAPVERFLARATAPPAAPVRVEVPFTRSHWEAALLAPTVSLARGWEKQLDTRFDGVLLAPGLTAAGYERWLQAQAVAYVALPDTPLDPSSAQEGRLIRRGLPYLQRVFASRHWSVYSVLAPTPIASGPGRLTSLGNDSFTLHASSPGRFLVRVHFTPYWTLARGAGCVARAPVGLDVCDGSRARHGGRRRALLARARAGPRRLLQRGRPALGAASAAAGHAAHREHPRSSHRRRPLLAGRVGVREIRRRRGRRDGRARPPGRAGGDAPGGCAGERRSLPLAGSHRGPAALDRRREPRARAPPPGGCPAREA